MANCFFFLQDFQSNNGCFRSFGIFQLGQRITVTRVVSFQRLHCTVVANLEKKSHFRDEIFRYWANKIIFYFIAMIKVKRKIVDNEVHDDVITCLDTPLVPNIAAIRCSLKSWRGMKFSLLLFCWLLLVTKLLMFVLLKMRLFKVLKLATALSPLHKGWSHMHTVARMMFTRWLEQSGLTAGALLQERLVTVKTKW